jgi:hypothetical protein
MPRKSTSPRPFKRAGLHPLECLACSNYAYSTVAALETHGRPLCPCNHEPMTPREVELCELLNLEDAPAVDNYRRTIESIWHGQEAHGSRIDRQLRDPHTVAMTRIVANRAADARKRRMAALGFAEMSDDGGNRVVVSASSPATDLPF